MDWFAALPKETQAAIVAAAAGAIGGILGATVTIGVTWINLRNERRRLTTQLTHDATEAKRQRDLQLRRDVLMAAADDALAQTRMLLSFANVDAPRSEMATSSPNYAGLAKAHMVGNLSTIKAFDAITSGLYSLKYYQFDAPGCDRPIESVSGLCYSDGYTGGSCEPGRRQR
jgi:hypothetical protein